MSKHVEFYFDFISPYAYFAWLQVRELCADNGATLTVHPVLFAGLLGHWGQLGPAEIPPKRVFTFKDIARYAALNGVPLEGPKTHPFNPLTALRLASVEVAGEHQYAVIDAIYGAGWGQGIDLGSPDALAKALDEAGLDGAALVAKTRDPAVKEALKQRTAAAVEQGVFGVPTLIVDGQELFFGNDRLHHVALYLQDKDPLDRARVARSLARPAGAKRA